MKLNLAAFNKNFALIWKKFTAHPVSKPLKLNLNVFAKFGENIRARLPFGREIFPTSNNFLIIRRRWEKLCTRQTRLRRLIRAFSRWPNAALFIMRIQFIKFFICAWRNFIASGQIDPSQIGLLFAINFSWMRGWLLSLINLIFNFFHLHKTIDTTLEVRGKF